MTDREEIMRRIEDHLDERGAAAPLPPDLEEAIARDPGLRAWLEENAAIEELLPDALEEAVPDGLHGRIMERVRAARTPRARRLRITLWLAPLAAAAALVLFLVVPRGERIVEPGPPFPATIPRISVDEALRAPAESIRATREDLVRSAGSFLESTARLLPELPDGTSPTPDADET